ncbi:hypothetical protein CEXT_653671 [Caerostris extrusa]|uniref:Uncharacterized protein n=1 Tax=Caerostris extrusa TaxID=172846 RepID=A0AAV4N8M3_CAEEX|nr:hypothetical protein CEXT_653671 [Caerostris extrusa]
MSCRFGNVFMFNKRLFDFSRLENFTNTGLFHLSQSSLEGQFKMVQTRPFKSLMSQQTQNKGKTMKIPHCDNAVPTLCYRNS